MKNTFGPLSNPIEPEMRTVLEEVARVATGQHVPLMLLGAFARELHFYHLHGIACSRRTLDVDFSIQVRGWQEYEGFRKALFSPAGFQNDSADHPEKLRHMKDGTDISFIVEHYLDTGRRQRLLSPSGLEILRGCGNDLDLASAVLLGRDMAEMMEDRTKTFLQKLLQHETQSGSRCHVVRGMMSSKRYSTFPRDSCDQLRNGFGLL